MNRLGTVLEIRGFVYQAKRNTEPDNPKQDLPDSQSGNSEHLRLCLFLHGIESKLVSDTN